MASTPSGGGRSFSADVLSRILTILHAEGPTKKTNLAGKTRLNYLTCIKYLDLLKSLGLVQTIADPTDGGERITVSEFGLRFNSSLVGYLQKECGSNPAECHQFSNENKLAEFIQNEITNTVMTGHEDNDEGDQVPGKKIMLVDDEKDILFTYKLFLAEGGFEVDVFSDPSAALRQIAFSPSVYQLVITDIRMSSINGLQLYHGIKALNQNIKVIFLSALDAADELVSILPGLERTFVLKKPVNRDVFTRTVELAMGRNGMLSAMR